MNRHTSPPWIAKNEGGSGWLIDPARIWCGNTSAHSHAETAANAKLVAAAPELLAALQGLLLLDEDHQRGADDQDVCLEIRDARAAIAKATKGKP